MCRSIKTLRGQLEVTDDEVTAAALQFVRKISGYRQPSKANQAAFESAVEEVAASTAQLPEALGTPPHASPDVASERTDSPPDRPRAPPRLDDEVLGCPPL